MYLRCLTSVKFDAWIYMGDFSCNYKLSLVLVEIYFDAFVLVILLEIQNNLCVSCAKVCWAVQLYICRVHLFDYASMAPFTNMV